MSHTPGPWLSAPTGEVMSGYSQPFGVMQSGQKNLIAGCFGDGTGGHEAAEANARLIAAAPELLEACKWFMQALEDGRLVRDITKDARPDWAMQMLNLTRDLLKAQQAIAKAESEQ